MKTWTQLLETDGSIHDFIMKGNKEQKELAITTLLPICQFMDKYNSLPKDKQEAINCIMLGQTPASITIAKKPAARKPKMDIIKEILSINNGKASLAILDNVVIKKDGTLYGTNLDVHAYYKLPNYSAKEDVCIPAATLKGLKAEDILSCEWHKNTFKDNGKDVVSYIGILETSKAKIKCSGDDPKDYPKPVINDKSKAYVFDVSKEDIDKMISLKDFCGSDDLRPVLSGVHINRERKELVATDAHKLKWMSHNIDLPEMADDIIIDKKYLRYLLPGMFTVQGGYLTIVSEETKVVIRLTDGKYPKYENVIPTESPFTIEIDRKKMIDNIQLLSKVWNKYTKQVWFDPTNIQEKMGAEDIDMGTEMELNAPVLASSINQPEPYKNDDGELITPEPLEFFRIGFNGEYMVNVLKSFDTPTVKINMSSYNKAMIFDNCALLIPVMLKD